MKDFFAFYPSIFGTYLMVQTILTIIYLTYTYKNIPNYKVGIIEHNLESTPIYDILSGQQCEDYSKTSNILGYYFGYDEGFKSGSTSYPKDYENSICHNEDYKVDCTDFDANYNLIEYKYFKGERLCTSKRPNKNYFDYLQSSIGINEICKEGTKKCGKLDANRILCVKEGEKCPINDIVYNKQSNYTKDNITYKSVNISYNEYIHYTNEQTENYIITNLTIIGGGESAFPCGSNDNDKFYSISEVDINRYCKGEETNYTYYFFNKLSSVRFKQFYDENNLSLIDLEEYQKDIYYKEDMVLFSTGYFSLSEEDIKIIKRPSDINKNNNYCKTISISYKIGFICAIVLGFSFQFILMPIIYCFKEINKFHIIVICYVILICLIITICGLIQMIAINLLYTITSYIPDFLFNNDVKNIMPQQVGVKYFLVYSFILIIHILFLILIISEFKHNKEKYF